MWAPAIIGAVLALAAGVGQAVVVNDLYEAVVEVPDTGREARREGFREALERVLVRLTGDASVTGNRGNEGESEGADLLARGADLVDAYSYFRSQDELRMQVSVSPTAVGRELAERGIAVWGANRPSVLVWFLADDRGERELVNRDASLPPFLAQPMQPLDALSLDESGAWKGPLTQHAARRGVPLVLPFFDETDRERLNLSEIWGLFPEPILDASARYAPDRVAVVRVSRLGGGWVARWVLQNPQGGTLADGTVRETSREAVTASLVDAWARRFASVFSVSHAQADEDRKLQLVVADVDSLVDYASVRRALMEMEPILAVEPASLKRDQLRLVARFSGSLTLVRDYLGLDQRLELMAAPDGGALGADGAPEPAGDRDPAEANTLYYRWRSSGDPDAGLESVDDMEDVRIVPIDDSLSPDGGAESSPSM